MFLFIFTLLSFANTFVVAAKPQTLKAKLSAAPATLVALLDAPPRWCTIASDTGKPFDCTMIPGGMLNATGIATYDKKTG